MRMLRRSMSSAVVTWAALLVLGFGADRGVQAQSDKPGTLTGSWIVNKDLSDTPQNPPGDDRGDDGSRGRRSGGGGGRGGRGGFGGGGFGGGGRNTGRATADPEQTARLRNAMRDLMNPSDRLTIVQTDTMIIITGSDGRTTRLSPDGKKVKDDSTKFEWKTKWDGPKLVTEVTGLPSGKVLETYAVDAERRQLVLTLQLEDTRRPSTTHRVYDFDTR